MVAQKMGFMPQVMNIYFLIRIEYEEYEGLHSNTAMK